MAEVHVIGQLLGATGFSERNLFCKASPVHFTAHTCYRTISYVILIFNIARL